MSRKKILSEEEIKEIISLYQTTLPNKHKLGKKYGVAHKKITQLLIENDIKTTNSSGKISSDIELSKVSVLKPTNKDNKLVAVCKETGKVFNDAMNKSGTLTNHIINTLSLDVIIPSNTYQRKKYEKLNGCKWYEQYFDLIEEKNEETLQCELCDWVTEDIDNVSGSITKHIKSNHVITITQYMDKFPHTKYLWLRTVEKEDLLSDSNNSVTCLECGNLFLGLTETHLIKSHNITMDEYKDKWGEGVDVFSKKTLKIISENTTELNKTMEFSFISKGQQAIADYIKSIVPHTDIIMCDKKVLSGVELDIYLPEFNLAIEYNGLYWHSENRGKHKHYHIDKTNLCENKDIRLIHIFDDEWIKHEGIVKQRLKHMLGGNKKSLYARKCTITPITSDISNEFLKNNHLQGGDKSSIRLGAYHDGVLVGVMTFSKLRKSLGYKNSIHQYEMVRFSTLGVVGLASKLLKNFIRTYDPIKIITYADRRWSKGNLYEVIGFENKGSTKPNYWYTKKHNKREHRFKYRKDILVNEGHDPNKTESQIMFDLGYDRIWDCGSIKYELNLK